MEPLVRSVTALLPYTHPKGNFTHISIHVDDLAPLTILLGPNASGKTSILEAIGYTIVPFLDARNLVLGLFLLSSLRPPRGVLRIPEQLAGAVDLDNGSDIVSIFLKITRDIVPMIKFVNDLLRTEILNKGKIDRDKIKNFLRSIAEDYRKLSALLSESYSELRGKYSNVLLDILKKDQLEVIEVPYVFAVRNISMVKTSKSDIELLKVAQLHPIWSRVLFLVYTIQEGEINKLVILRRPRFLTIIREDIREKLRIPKLVVFYSGFVHKPGVFERLYRAYIYEGLSNEKSAIDILRKYIGEVEGFELAPGRYSLDLELHLKLADGRRISVYDLSDGHRMAAFMGLLYAISGKDSLFLVDTPEAYVHPDGLSTMADFIIGLVEQGCQVILATQSIEFLRELLSKSMEHNMYDITNVKRVHLTDSGTVVCKGSWRGDIAYKSLEDLSIDLRL